MRWSDDAEASRRRARWSIRPKLAEWLEQNVSESLTVFSVPTGHWRRLRTNTMLERLNDEINRTDLGGGACSRTRHRPCDSVNAVLMEISEGPRFRA